MLLRTLAVWLTLLAAGVSCRHAAAPVSAPPAGTEKVPADSQQLLLALYGLPAVNFPGGEPPAWYRQAEALHEQGAEAYLAKAAYAEAAELFMRAAAGFRPPDGDLPDLALVGHRQVCYRNATCAWEMADMRKQAMQRLRSVAAGDEACAPELQKLIAALAR